MAGGRSKLCATLCGIQYARVKNAELNFSLRENTHNGIWKPNESINASHQDIFYTSILKVCQ
jgi:hypothetical protein